MSKLPRGPRQRKYSKCQRNEQYMNECLVVRGSQTFYAIEAAVAAAAREGFLEEGETMAQSTPALAIGPSYCLWHRK